MQYTATEIMSARHRLGMFVRMQAEKYKRRMGVDYVPVVWCKAPSTLEEIRSAYLEAKAFGTPFPVWSGASANTIYMNAGLNHAFRFWHDMLHVALGLETILTDEIELGAMQTGAVMAQFGFDSLEGKLMRLDTMGQSLYAYEHEGQFPENQLQFVLDTLKDL